MKTPANENDPLETKTSVHCKQILKYMLFLSICLGFLAGSVVLSRSSSDEDFHASSLPSSHRRLSTSTTQIPIFLFTEEHPSLVVRKQVFDLRTTANDESVSPKVTVHVASTVQEQRSAIKSSCDGPTLKRFQAFIDIDQNHLATEVYKYCSLRPNGGIYVDAESPLFVRIPDLLTSLKMTPLPNVAILGDNYLERTIHGSFLHLSSSSQQLAENMLKVLVETPLEDFIIYPLLLSRTLYDLIETETKEKLRFGANGPTWFLLEERCHMDPLTRPEATDRSSWTQAHSYRSHHSCAESTGYCCSVHDDQGIVLSTRHPILPFQKIPKELRRPYNAETGHFVEEELPYIATIREQVFSKPQNANSKNFFDILMQNHCLPDSVKCAKCLRDKDGSNCAKCAEDCPCYCKTLCTEHPEPQFVSKKLTISPPMFARDPNRLVPRIVHQTYFEDLTPDKYPNMSRLVESFKQSGWEYRFYSDEDAQNFLSTHFPAEVREAYDTLVPGAFKADLFRYCVLLIFGGVYADVDIMLESSLDISVPPDVGFMVPVDEPGIEVERRMCLWNGLIASAPGHPFMARAVETVVNQVRNRFTSVDVDATFCPNPELSVLHAFDMLFTAGPCLLGSSVNRVLGRNPQENFVAGDLKSPSQKALEKGAAFVLGTPSDDPESRIPGRSIILHQNKWDMGSHRFTLLAQNLVVAATDMEDSDDRANQASSGKSSHYSKTHAAIGIYGLQGLYTNRNAAHEDIKFEIDMSQSKFETKSSTMK